MPDAPSRPDRRRALQFLASLPALAVAGEATATPGPFPQEVSILVAGPDQGELNAWSRLITPLLARFLPQGAPVRVVRAGGADGVTGANQFDTRVVPDGGTVLLVPGTAALAWLAGDPRARFDAGHWVPVMAGITPAIVAGRPGFGWPGQGARVAAAGPSGPEMSALLALDLIGANPVPVFGLMEPATVRDAFARREVDLVFVSGRNVPDRLAALAELGAKPLFSLRPPDPDGRPTRDALFSGLPDLAELHAGARRNGPEGRLYDAWVAAASAARLDFGLVLPQLTPAARVALWRRAGAQAIVAPELQSVAAAAAVRPLAGQGAATSTAAVAADPDAILELRRWLGARFNWHPV